MTVMLNFIQGFMCGFEFVEDEEEKYIVIDLFILRILVCR